MMEQPSYWPASRATPAQPGRAYFWWGCLAGVAGSIFSCVILSVLLGVLIAQIVGDPKGLVLSREGPCSVAEGDAFDIVLHVTNNGAEQMAIDGIGLDADDFSGLGVLTEGASIVGTDPKLHRSETDVGRISYEYSEALAPGETRTFTFHMQAHSPGTYAGQLLVHVGMKSKSIDYPLTVVGREGE